jgi:hypothetical protein
LFSDWLHVWQGYLLCWHGIKECELLSCFKIGAHRTSSLVWCCIGQHVSLNSFWTVTCIIHIYTCYIFFRHELKAASYIEKLPKGKHSTKGKMLWLLCG